MSLIGLKIDTSFVSTNLSVVLKGLMNPEDVHDRHNSSEIGKYVSWFG